MWLPNLIWQRITIVLIIKLFDYLIKGICLCKVLPEILNCTSIIVDVHVFPLMDYQLHFYSTESLDNCICLILSNCTEKNNKKQKSLIIMQQ